MALERNLTGEQIQQVLDVFLFKAIEPIVLNTDVFDVQVSYVLGLISANRKRKPSSLDRNKVIHLLCTYLITEDRQEKLHILRQARLERFFLHVFVSKLLNEFNGYVGIYHAMMVETKPESTQIRKKLDALASTLDCNRRELYSVMNLSRAYLNEFYKFRSVVLGHYIKLASRQAKIYADSGKGNFDFLDVRQSILKSILLALDKYDSSKGALTSYINWWILNAQTCGVSEHEYGIAYTIPQTHRKKIAQKNSDSLNYSVSMDELSSDDSSKPDMHTVLGGNTDMLRDYEYTQEISLVCYLAKCVDTRGVARLFLDVGETFNDRELQQMSEQTSAEIKSVNT